MVHSIFQYEDVIWHSAPPIYSLAIKQVFEIVITQSFNVFVLVPEP